MFLAVRRIQAILREVKAKVRFCHVPRHANDFADWLGGVARWREGNVDLTAWCQGLGVGTGWYRSMSRDALER